MLQILTSTLLHVLLHALWKSKFKARMPWGALQTEDAMPGSISPGPVSLFKVDVKKTIQLFIRCAYPVQNRQANGKRLRMPASH
eukprot:354617-Chlamydomonas_euryale.AAC.9